MGQTSSDLLITIECNIMTVNKTEQCILGLDCGRMKLNKAILVMIDSEVNMNEIEQGLIGCEKNWTKPDWPRVKMNKVYQA